MVTAPNSRGPAALYLAAAIGAILTAIGIWQAAVAWGPSLLLANGIAILVLTAIAFWFYRRDGGAR